MFRSALSLFLSILILILHLHPKLQDTEPSQYNTDSFLFTIKQTDKMKFSALVSTVFVAFAAAACKEGAYSWCVLVYS